METVSDSEYISRDAVDTKLLAMEERFIDNPFALTAIAMAMDKIDKIPAADVAPVVNAHWTHLGGGLAKCSNCEWIFKDVYDQDNEDTFCRKCGAKMDEEAENV